MCVGERESPRGREGSRGGRMPALSVKESLQSPES